MNERKEKKRKEAKGVRCKKINLKQPKKLQLLKKTS